MRTAARTDDNQADIVAAARLRQLLHYDAETGVFTRLVSRGGYRSGNIAGRKNSRGYREICVDRRLYSEHRLAWLYVYGHWPSKNIDHINGVSDDNRIANLREANQKENRQNIRKASTNSNTGFLGVSRRRGRFRATIKIDGKARHLGDFDTPQKAYEAYLSAKRVLHPFGMI